MTDWRAALGDRLVTPEAAAARVRPGHLVRLAIGQVPTTLVTALAARRDELRDVRVLQGATGFPQPWMDTEPGWDAHVRYVTDYATVLARPCLEARRGDFAVADYAVGSKVQHDGRRDGWAADVFMAPVSEPDADGRVHLGWGPWHTKALLRAARVSVAEVTRGVWPVRGDTTVPLDAFDLVVESRDEPFTVPSAYPEPTGERADVTDAVGAAVAKLVRDRDTIQIGTGTLSSCMGRYLLDRRDLGIDSEILVPSAIELVKRGVATGRWKTHHPGVATAALITPGCDRDTCCDNPAVALYDVEWVNNLPRIAGIQNLVAINQALVVDLTGQVAAESLGPVMFSGPGGQLMWTMGALFAPGGRAVQVLPSTARGGTVSRIVPSLEPGTIVTVPRTFVDFVVTEHGTANLQGLTQRERALALIDLAHPRFRTDLRVAARRLFWPD